MKVITLGQFERDLDRILDDVTDENEHYCVKTPVISDLKEKGGLVWEDKAVMILPIEDYDLLKETYDMWLANCKEEATVAVDPGDPGGFLGIAFA